jgi:hypothetical protein
LLLPTNFDHLYEGSSLAVALAAKCVTIRPARKFLHTPAVEQLEITQA